MSRIKSVNDSPKQGKIIAHLSSTPDPSCPVLLKSFEILALDYFLKIFFTFHLYYLGILYFLLFAI